MTDPCAHWQQVCTEGYQTETNHNNDKGSCHDRNKVTCNDDQIKKKAYNTQKYGIPTLDSKHETRSTKMPSDEVMVAFQGTIFA